MEEDISNQPSETTTDISNKTIVVLVILTVIISVLGTMVVLSQVSSINIPTAKAVDQSTTTQGQVSLTINGPPPEPEVSTGMVSLNILPKGK